MSTYIKVPYIKVVYIKETYIKVVYIKVPYIKVVYIKETYIKVVYIKETYIKVVYIKVTYIKVVYIKVPNNIYQGLFLHKESCIDFCLIHLLIAKFLSFCSFSIIGSQQAIVPRISVSRHYSICWFNSAI